MESPTLLRQLTRTGVIVAHIRHIYLNSRLWETPLSADFHAVLRTSLPDLLPWEQTKLDFLLALEEKTPVEVYEMFSGLLAERQGLLGKVKAAFGSQVENQERQERRNGILGATESFYLRPACGRERMNPRQYPLLLRQRRYSEYEKGLRTLCRKDIPNVKELQGGWKHHSLRHRLAEEEGLKRLQTLGQTDLNEVFDDNILIWRERGFCMYDLDQLNRMVRSLALSKEKRLAPLERIYAGVHLCHNNYGSAVPALYAEIQAFKDDIGPGEL